MTQTAVTDGFDEYHWLLDFLIKPILLFTDKKTLISDNNVISRIEIESDDVKILITSTK